MKASSLSRFAQKGVLKIEQAPIPSQKAAKLHAANLKTHAHMSAEARLAKLLRRFHLVSMAAPGSI
jgi:hypothetical protein